MSGFSSIAALVLLTKAFSQDPLYPLEPTEAPWTPPTDESEFNKFNLGSRYEGRLFVSNSEFNWVVDVRLVGMKESWWATGNVVSYSHVLTTCRAARVWLNHTKTKYHTNKRLVKPYLFEVTSFAYSNIMVSYCGNNLKQDEQLPQMVSNVDLPRSGSRRAKEIALHPSCSKYFLMNDAAAIVLLKGIYAVPPIVGYMPLDVDYRTEKTRKLSLTHVETAFCEVVSFGRGFSNVPSSDDLVFGYKVKYRAYLNDWKLCRDVFNYICSGPDPEQCKDDQGDNQLLCFSTRARVGTVCDHDMGSPVVCSGKVIGMVIRGAKSQHCNDVYRIPFIVLSIDGFGSFVDDTIDWLFNPVKKYEVEAQPTSLPFSGSAARQTNILAIAAAGANHMIRVKGM